MKKTKQSPTNDSTAKRQSPALSRRRFIGKVTGATAAMTAAGAGLPSLLAADSTAAQKRLRRAVDAPRPRSASPYTGGNPVSGPERRSVVFRVRAESVFGDLRKPLPELTTNGDETLYGSDGYIGSFSKSLPHDQYGVVVPSAYEALITATTSGSPAAFDAIPIGGDVPLIGPQDGLNIALDVADVATFTIPPAPALASSLRAAEMIESYWLALCRDIPFCQFGQEPLTQAAMAELNSVPAYTQNYGRVTAQNLFRGFTPDATIGPYVSQFLVLPIGHGLGNLAMNNTSDKPAQLYNVFLPGVDYMTTWDSFLAVQNGQATVPSQARGFFGAFGTTTVQDSPAYLNNGRSMSSLVHVDELYQHYFWAASELLGDNFPFSAGNPYNNTPNQIGFAVWGGPYVMGLMGEAAMRAVHSVWYQKWFVHRSLRPEAYAGWVHNTLSKNNGKGGGPAFPLDPSVLHSKAAAQVFSKYGTYLLPMAFQEGCPVHPSYGSGHATVAGGSVTILKALFNESTSFLDMGITPMYSPDGTNLEPYTGSDVDQITVGTELNKIAWNIGIGRNFAGVHWHSDYAQSLMLGEAMAISLLQNLVHTYTQNAYFSFTKFDGTPITISR
jgi:hypothetical protein